MPVDYKHIPVAKAREISKQYGKDFVIILAYDAKSGYSHITTFGADLAFKHLAAHLGEIAARAIGFDIGSKIEYEDFRHRAEGAYEEER